MKKSLIFLVALNSFCLKNCASEASSSSSRNWFQEMVNAIITSEDVNSMRTSLSELSDEMMASATLSAIPRVTNRNFLESYKDVFAGINFESVNTLNVIIQKLQDPHVNVTELSEYLNTEQRLLFSLGTDPMELTEEVLAQEGNREGLLRFLVDQTSELTQKQQLVIAIDRRLSELGAGPSHEGGRVPAGSIEAIIQECLEGVNREQ